MLLPFRANQEYEALLMTHILSGSARSSILRGRGGIAPDDAARRGAQGGVFTEHRPSELETKA